MATRRRKLPIIYRIILVVAVIIICIQAIINIKFRIQSKYDRKSSQNKTKQAIFTHRLTPDIRTYNFPPLNNTNDRTAEPSFLDQFDPSLLLTSNVYDIQETHGRALLHFGSWIYIVDANSNLLFLKRKPTMVLCPSSWSLLGEHASIKDEDPVLSAATQERHYDDSQAARLVRRGIREELGDHVVDRIVEMKSLTEFPVYFVRDYGAAFGGRVDRQMTYLFYVRLADANEGIEWGFDEEVAETRWVKVSEAKKWVSGEEFCHWRMRRLFDLGIDQLVKLLEDT